MKFNPIALRAIPLAVFAFSISACNNDVSTELNQVLAPNATPAPPTGEMQTVLDALASLNGKPIETLSVDEARKQPTMTDAVTKVRIEQTGTATIEAVTTVSDIPIDGAVGKISARFYKPGTDATYPVVLYFHGGGFVIATNDTYDASARAIANQAHAIVLSVEYRKGPENRFPAAHDDALAAYKWTIANIASYGGNPAKIAVVGESAGGNLALNVGIMARDQHLQAPVHLGLIYPLAGKDFTTPSYNEEANAKPLNRAMVVWFFGNYLNSINEAGDLRMDLIHANLGSLPPTTIINAQIDPLRSDGEMLADKMKGAGDTVTQKTFMGVTHEFFGAGPVVKEARDAQALLAASLIAAW